MFAYGQKRSWCVQEISLQNACKWLPASQQAKSFRRVWQALSIEREITQFKSRFTEETQLFMVRLIVPV